MTGPGNVNCGKFHLLTIEDNQADIELVKVLLAQISGDIIVHCARDGVEASDFLFKRGRHEGDVIVPDLILMDLNIPKKDGRALLKEIKAHPQLCKIPVVMLSTSSSDREVSDSYCLGASAFISKPLNLAAFQETLGALVKFYFGCARLATRPGRIG